MIPSCMDAKRHTRTLLLFILCFLGIVTSSVWAADIAFVSHKKLGSVKQLADKTATLLDSDVEIHGVNDDVDWSRFRAVVLVGAKAVKQWQVTDTPSIAVFISEAAAEAFSDKLNSAVFIEPPLQRQVILAKEILGSDRPLGILVSSKKNWHFDSFLGKPLSSSLITPYFVDQFDNLNRALVELLRNNHALVGIYDTKLYSSINIKNILITAYRQNKALIGPSSAYIKAGALATTYSDLDDVARRLEEILQSGLKNNRWPAAGYNPYFKIRYNEQVGRSLNLLLPDSDELVRKIRKVEGGA